MPSSSCSAEAVQGIRGVDEWPACGRSSPRDVEGFEAAEVCDLLDLSEGNQRVLLHRARTKVREALAEYFA